LIIIFIFHSVNMRIKRVPRHRMLQSSIKIARESLVDEESNTDVEKDYNLTYTLDSYQVANYLTFFTIS